MVQTSKCNSKYLNYSPTNNSHVSFKKREKISIIDKTQIGVKHCSC